RAAPGRAGQTYPELHALGRNDGAVRVVGHDVGSTRLHGASPSQYFRRGTCAIPWPADCLAIAFCWCHRSVLAVLGRAIAGRCVAVVVVTAQYRRTAASLARPLCLLAPLSLYPCFALSKHADHFADAG